MNSQLIIPAAARTAELEHASALQAEANEALFQPGPFPLDVMTETQKQIVSAVAEVHQIPVELAAMPALAVTAASLGKAWQLEGAVNGRSNFANLYCIVGAQKSTGKGAGALLASPIVKASGQLVEQWQATERPGLEAKRQVLEAKIKFLTNRIVRGEHGPKALLEPELERLTQDMRIASEELERLKPLLAANPSYHVGNATSEALAMKFARNDDTLFALAYEGGDILRVMLGKYSKGEQADCDLWLSGYSVEPYQSDRILRGAVNITPCLTALVFCQPTLIQELYSNEEAFERGLTARVLPFICASSLHEDDGTVRQVSVYTSDAWQDLITQLLAQRAAAKGCSQIVMCSPEAREIFRAYHNESIRLRQGVFNDMEGELGRWRENACRIALGICIAEDPAARSLTGDQAARAVRIARWAQYSGLAVMQSGRLQRRLSRVERLEDLLLDHKGEVTLRVLEKNHGFPAAEVEQLATDFPGKFLVATKQNPAGGPSSRMLKAWKT